MAVRQLDDAELIEYTRAGDSNAYGELYRRHYEAARAAAHGLTRNRCDADDLISEAFARVLRASRSGGGPDVSFRPYLVAAVRNVFFDRVRCNRERPSNDMFDDVRIASASSENDHEHDASVTAALAGLPERWQRILWHAEVEGRSAAEIGLLLGLSPNAVAALAYRAREGLRQAYVRVQS